MHDNRLAGRLVKYWDMLRKDQAMPEAFYFNPTAVEDLWERCFRLRVLHYHGAKTTYQFDHMGDDIVASYGKNLTDEMITSKMRFPGSTVIKQIDSVVANPRILSDEGQFVSEKNKIVKYRACLLPFGSPRDGVTHVVVGMSWREVH